MAGSDPYKAIATRSFTSLTERAETRPRAHLRQRPAQVGEFACVHYRPRRSTASRGRALEPGGSRGRGSSPPHCDWQDNLLRMDGESDDPRRAPAWCWRAHVGYRTEADPRTTRQPKSPGRHRLPCRNPDIPTGRRRRLPGRRRGPESHVGSHRRDMSPDRLRTRGGPLPVPGHCYRRARAGCQRLVGRRA
jgi:hypothetical protein